MSEEPEHNEKKKRRTVEDLAVITQSEFQLLDTRMDRLEKKFEKGIRVVKVDNKLRHDEIVNLLQKQIVPNNRSFWHSADHVFTRVAVIVLLIFMVVTLTGC